MNTAFSYFISFLSSVTFTISLIGFGGYIPQIHLMFSCSIKPQCVALVYCKEVSSSASMK